jgi:hypothetical protein
VNPHGNKKDPLCFKKAGCKSTAGPTSLSSIHWRLFVLIDTGALSVQVFADRPQVALNLAKPCGKRMISGPRLHLTTPVAGS